MGPEPDRILAVSAVLGRVFGAQLVIPTVVVWPTWFDLSIVGDNTGAWSDAFFSANRASVWRAHDDRGQTYVGATLAGGSGGGLTTHNLSFIPALDPAARTLALDFPPGIDGSRPRTEIDLTGG